MERAGRLDLLRTPRRKNETIIVDGRSIVLRDQKPLHKGNIKLPNGFTFEDFVETLNRRIFFWPGSKLTPIDYGMRHFAHYESDNPVILRIDLDSLVQGNPLLTPHFCRYNSGSPRCSHGKRIPRSPRTFLAATHFVGTPSQVVEITFQSEIRLPLTTEFGRSPGGPWKTLKRD
jgi:hypothetical protein